jgi:Flp pilus assembly protein TadG
MKKIIEQKGAAMVEFAIVLPLFLVLVFGIIEFSLMLYDQAIITNASREGARSAIALRTPPLTASSNPTLTNFINNVVTSYCSTNLITFGSKASCWIGDKNNGPPTVFSTYPTVITTTPTTPSGTPLTVQTNYTYTFLVFGNLINLLTNGRWGNTINLSARTVMYFE